MAVSRLTAGKYIKLLLLVCLEIILNNYVFPCVFLELLIREQLIPLSPSCPLWQQFLQGIRPFLAMGLFPFMLHPTFALRKSPWNQVVCLGQHKTVVKNVIL